MIIPMVVDKDKDAALIEWLNGKTNRSAFMRFTLYEKMEGNAIKRTENHEKVVEIEDSLIKSLEGL
jgi:hypothetical protein